MTEFDRISFHNLAYRITWQYGKIFIFLCPQHEKGGFATRKTKKRHRGQGSVYRSATGWTAEISLGYDSRTGQRKRKKASAPTKKEALEKLKDMLTATEIADASMTFGNWLQSWYVANRRCEIRENTARCYEYCIRTADEELGAVRLHELTRDTLQRTVTRRFGGHRRAAELFRTVISMALAGAVKDGIIHENPATDIVLPPKKRKKEFAGMTPDKWQALMNARTALPCWRLLILTELLTGLRRSELLGLTWNDVRHTRDGGELKINSALIVGRTVDGRRPLIMAGTKTEAGQRTLPLPKSYMDELENYREEQLRSMTGTGRWTAGPLIFTTAKGEAINPDTFSAMYYRARKKLGIESTFHQLRHDMATSMKESGLFDMKDMQSQLGHSSIRVTMDIYTHAGAASRQKVGRWIEERGSLAGA